MTSPSPFFSFISILSLMLGRRGMTRGALPVERMFPSYFTVTFKSRCTFRVTYMSVGSFLPSLLKSREDGKVQFPERTRDPESIIRGKEQQMLVWCWVPWKKKKKRLFGGTTVNFFLFPSSQRALNSHQSTKTHLKTLLSETIVLPHVRDFDKLLGRRVWRTDQHSIKQ